MAKITNTKTELNLLDRLVLPTLFKGKEANFITMKVIKDIKKKVELTQAEFTKYDIKAVENGLSYNEAGVKAKFRIDFTDRERDEIKASLRKLDETEKLTEEFVELYDKFIKK